MFNLVQPVFNPFGLAGTAYGLIWPSVARNGRFGGPLRPLGIIFDGFKGVQLVPHMGQFLQGGKNGRLMSFFF